MSAVGDKEILLTQTLLIADEEVGKFVVPVGADQLKVTIRFQQSSSNEQSVEWRFEDGILHLDCNGWNNSQGGALVKAHRIGQKDGQPLGFNLVQHKIGPINHVTLQFYLGGTYE